MNKKDYAILSRLEGQIGGLEKLLVSHQEQIVSHQEQIVSHQKQSNRALYIPLGILGISFLGSGLSLVLSKVSPSPIFAALPLMIAGLYALVYSVCELLRP